MPQPHVTTILTGSTTAHRALPPKSHSHSQSHSYVEAKRYHNRTASGSTNPYLPSNLSLSSSADTTTSNPLAPPPPLPPPPRYPLAGAPTTTAASGHSPSLSWARVRARSASLHNPTSPAAGLAHPTSFAARANPQALGANGYHYNQEPSGSGSVHTTAASGAATGTGLNPNYLPNLPHSSGRGGSSAGAGVVAVEASVGVTSASARSTRSGSGSGGSGGGGGDQTRAVRHQTHEAHLRRDRDQRPSGQIQSQPRPSRLTTAYDGFSSDDARSNKIDDDDDNNNNNNNNNSSSSIDTHTSEFDYYPDDHPAPSSPAIFATGTLLPRTSSLLPPIPHNLGHAGRVPLPHISTSNHNPIIRETSLFFFDPEVTPRRPHSRSSSSGAVSDSFRNLNRWSVSTASTRTSRSGSGGTGGIIGGAGAGDLQQSPPVKKPSRLANFSRRMSVDSVALLTRATADHSSQPSATHPSPRRLAKRRPSNASSNLTKSPSTGSLVSNTPTRLHSNSPAPPPNLPPIVALPVLQLPAVNPSASPTFRIDTQDLPGYTSPAVGAPVSTLSDQSYSLSTGSNDHLWDDQADRTNAPPPFASRGNTPALPPSDQMTSAVNTMPPEKKGHTRSRSSNAQSSSDSTSRPRDRDRVVDHRGKQPSQKAMLSKALAKANTAVQLDNAQNYEGARHSYNEACSLLQQVLDRTTGDEDKKKLEAIRRTYTSRIEELDGMVPMQFNTGPHAAKALPARPESLDYNGVEVRPSYEDDDLDEPVHLETATAIRGARSPTPDRRNLTTPAPADQLTSVFSRSPRRRNFEGSLTIPRQEDGGYLPAPLSPRRVPSPSQPADPTESVPRQDFSMPSNRLSVHGAGTSGHTRNLSHESTSWLDPIDESGGSAPSSVHSRTSSFGIRRRHIRSASGDTEAEFDTALDAAIEAAYDDGYEVNESSDMYDHEEEDDPIVAQAMRRVEWAKEQVRQSEREAAIGQAREQDRQRRLLNNNAYDEGGFYNGSDSEEEERMLEEFTRNYAMQNFSFDQPSRQQAGAGSEHGRERESDSSGITQRTWHSSMGSNPPPTASTVLSTVNEMPTPLPKPTAPTSLPPSQALPQIPLPQPPSAAVTGSPSSVRGRRLSGQNPKQLKIETSKITAQQPAPGGPVSAFQTKAGNYLTQQRQVMSATTSTRPGPFSMRASGSPPRGVSPAPAVAPPTPTRTQTLSGDSGEDLDEFLESPTSKRPLRKNQSSSSLRSLKTRQFSAVSIADTLSDLSPNTPYSSSMSSRQPAMPALPTPVATAFSQKMMGGFGGLYLFDSDFHSPAPHSPGSIHQASPDAPLPLEPCPADAMLRPFWLMRALYQTLSHQRGGYVTNRLFIPRDVWKVKGVKLRALEDKSSQCDLLTAALLKLQRVDSTDADAVLEEMQSFESVLEQVQMTLNKKLGSEVGSQGMSLGGESEAAPAVPRSASVSSKGSTFSWRRLRNKGSAANMSSSYGSKGNSTSSNSAKETIPEKEAVGAGSGSMPSLPMVAQPSGRPAKRDVGSISFDGPYAGYMASLARLFDAAQAVDQIARQVDDPGLRHADKTQVGLELCTRHAAEFFGFYICRFVLADLSLLLDKFVKRGSEWVLT